MKMVSPHAKEIIFYWALAFVSISLPFPDYSLNSKAIIFLVAAWLFTGNFTEKKHLFKSNGITILILTSPFWMAALGLLYTDNLHGGLRELEIKLPFLIFPTTILTHQWKTKTTFFVLDYFTIGVAAASLLALCKGLYFKLNGLGDYLFYSRFAEFLDKHTTYFSMFVILCLLHLFRSLFLKRIKRRLGIVAIVFFLSILYILSVRISIIALIAGSILLLLVHYKGKIKFLVAGTIPLLLLLFYLSPNFQKRAEPSAVHNSEIIDSQYREFHWKAVLQTISHNSIVFGSGTRANREFLYLRYKEYGLSAAEEERYNAHNQFLEILLDYGLIGLSVFFGMLLFLARRYFKSRDYFAITCLLVMSIFMITESTLVRQSGVVVFAFFNCLFVSLSITLNTKFEK